MQAVRVGGKASCEGLLGEGVVLCPQCSFMGCSKGRAVVAPASAGRHPSLGTRVFLLPLKGISIPAAPKTAPCHVPSPCFEWGWRKFKMLGMKEWCGGDVHQPLPRKGTSHTPAVLSPPRSCSGAGAEAGECGGGIAKPQAGCSYCFFIWQCSLVLRWELPGLFLPIPPLCPALLGAPRFYSLLCGSWSTRAPPKSPAGGQSPLPGSGGPRGRAAWWLCGCVPWSRLFGTALQQRDMQKSPRLLARLPCPPIELYSGFYVPFP